MRLRESCSHVTKSITDQHVGPCKTEASQKPVPLDPELAEALLMWRRQSPSREDKDWVFASPAKQGTLPYWSFSGPCLIAANSRCGIASVGEGALLSLSFAAAAWLKKAQPLFLERLL
jgi:hypothetical protein